MADGRREDVRFCVWMDGWMVLLLLLLICVLCMTEN